ncbi:MAG: hypothetical protein IKE41_01480, partial [Clostridia bacterium]|nr:hypothetical protein [Clostridia bacterium]MBR2735031.1 hypothetical protein [Clostridia bacterium]
SVRDVDNIIQTLLSIDNQNTEPIKTPDRTQTFKTMLKHFEENFPMVVLTETIMKKLKNVFYDLVRVSQAEKAPTSVIKLYEACLAIINNRETDRLVRQVRLLRSLDIAKLEGRLYTHHR